MPAAVRVLGHVLALVAGVAAGVLGSFTFSYTDGGWPVGLLVGLCLCAGVFVVAGVALRSRAAAGVAVAGWLVAVGALSMERPEGDLIVPASTLGYSWLLVGFLVGAVSLALPYAAITAAPAGRAPADAPAEESSGRASSGR